MTGVAAEVGSTANNYRILARLATGGMAEIFLARGVSTTGVERHCVLKRILRERATDVHFVRMFLDEARLAAQLQHPNVAQVYDIGKLGDSYFFTMEYVHGETVRALLHRARSLRRDVPIGSVLTVIAGAAAGLHHAHERLGLDGRPLGIVHRDVSPSNLMVSYEGGVKVVDFGVAKAENRAQETRSGTVKGKIAYLSPEQCRGGAIDRRSDLFSLGIVFWEMLTTARLYKRNSDFENMTAIVTEEPPPPSSRNAGVPPEIDAVVLKLLAKDPAARFQSAEQLVEAIEGVAQRTGSMLSTAGLGRFMRELFGQRPEPWLELQDQTHEVPQEGVTVTSEPIPQELGIPAADALDQRLGAVPDLRANAFDGREEDFPKAGILTPASQMMTSPAVAIPARGPVVTLRGLPLPAPAPETQPGRPALPARPAPSQSGSGSGVQVFAPAPSSSGGQYPVVVRERPRRLRTGPLVAVITGAAVAGTLGVWFAMRDGDARPPVEPPPAVAPSAAAPPPPSPEPRDAGALVADAEPVAAADASAPAAVVDGAVAKPSPRDELQAMLDARRYADVVAACKRVTAEIAAPCTIAACRARQVAKARAWYARLDGGRPAVANACRDAGVAVVLPRPRSTTPNKPPPDAGVVDPCAANPMACQR